MRRAPGWIRLAGIALELTALAYIGYVLMGRKADGKRPQTLRHTQGASIPQHDKVQPVPQHHKVRAMEFIRESADENARFYRAWDETGEVFAGFYSDGRVRLSDAQHRFAGMLQSGHADLLEIDNNQWSEVFVRTTPTGRMQLELRGDPYDARVLTCESFDALRTTKE